MESDRILKFIIPLLRIENEQKVTSFPSSFVPFLTKCILSKLWNSHFIQNSPNPNYFNLGVERFLIARWARIETNESGQLKLQLLVLFWELKMIGEQLAFAPLLQMASSQNFEIAIFLKKVQRPNSYASLATGKWLWVTEFAY